MNFGIHNLTPVEVVWLFAALLGLAYAAVNLSHSHRDRAAAEKVYNGLRGSRIVVADGYVFRARMRVVIFAWWVLLGAAHGFFELPDIPKLAGTLGLIATAFAWSIIGIQEESERRTLDSLIAKAAAERLVRVGGEITTHLERTADNTARIAQATDEMLQTKQHEHEGDPR